MVRPPCACQAIHRVHRVPARPYIASTVCLPLSMSFTYCLLRITYYVLLITYYVLLITYCLLRITYYVLLITYYLLRVRLGLCRCLCKWDLMFCVQRHYSAAWGNLLDFVSPKTVAPCGKSPWCSANTTGACELTSHLVVSKPSPPLRSTVIACTFQANTLSYQTVQVHRAMILEHWKLQTHHEHGVHLQQSIWTVLLALVSKK